MAFINKIKTNYYIKLIKANFKDNDFAEAAKNLLKLRKIDDLEYNRAIHKTINYIINQEGCSELFNNNIIWINSFYIEDTKILNKFLKLYLGEDDRFQNTIMSYYESFKETSVDDDLILFNQNSSLNHYYAQSIISKSINNSEHIFINSSNAFFENAQQLRFTHTSLTKCYFYVIRSPFDIYNDLKINLNSREALNTLMNLDSRKNIISLNSTNKITNLEEDRQGWSTNVKSWTNINTVGAFRGLVINFDDLISDPKSVFAEMLAHLREAGIDINIDYDRIDKIIDTIDFPISKINNKFKLSNKEIKMINKECGDLINEFDLDKKI